MPEGSSCAALFDRAVGLYSSDVMLCIQAGAHYQDYWKLIKDAQACFRRYEAGIYAPNLDTTWWTGERADLSSELLGDANLKLVAAPGETLLFVRREVLHGLGERNITLPVDLPWNGLDTLLSALSYAKGMPVIRDYSHTVGRSGRAAEENGPVLPVMDQLEPYLDQDLRKVFAVMRGDRQELVRYLTKDPGIPRVLGTRQDYILGSLELKRLSQFFDLHSYPTFVETGTFKGAGVQWALESGFSNVYSVEISQTIYNAAVARFGEDPRVRLRLGDSKRVLPEILKEIQGPALFYLDAHCSGRFEGIDTGGAPEGLPLQAESLTLMEYGDIDRCLIVIDDERLMVDPPGPSGNFGSNIRTWLLDNWCGRRGFHATYLDDSIVFTKS